jgi:cytochrome c-type biogenesis protein CcmH/NrfG
LRLSQIGTLINNPPTSQEVLKQNFQALFSAAEAAARNAVNYDRTNPENWVMLASVYQRVVPLQVEGAKSNAIAAYEEGRKLSPQNPGFDLLRARLEIAANNLPEAKTHIEAALAKKPNFITALLLLSQIEENQNNLSTAEDALRKAIQYAPMNSDALLAFGLYKYRRAEYQAAVPLLERTLVVNRSSATAAYFLGLSYEKVGRIEEAKKIFDILKKSFPNDTTLLKIDENLQAGKAALDGLSSSPASVAEEEKKTTEQ